MDLTKLIGKTLVFIDCATDDRLVSHYGVITHIADDNEIWTKNYPTGTYLMDEEEEERLYDGQPAWVHMNEVYCYIEPKFTEI